VTQLRVSQFSDARQIKQAINGALRRTDPFDVSSDQATATVDRPFNVVTGAYQIAGVQVLGPRLTGWVADTGTAETTAHATYTAGTTLTFSATYTQSELNALATRLAAVEAALQGVTRGQKALKDAAISHGLIGS
jgi:hypothetical protein